MNRKPEKVIIAEPSLDINMLDYAGNGPPENTIERIEALEKLTDALW